MSTLQEFGVLLACGYCGAEPGVWCRTVKGYTRPPGQRSPFLHQSRMDVIYDVWRDAVDSGRESMRNTLAWNLQEAARGHHWAVRQGIPTTATPEVIAWIEAAR